MYQSCWAGTTESDIKGLNMDISCWSLNQNLKFFLENIFLLRKLHLEVVSWCSAKKLSEVFYKIHRKTHVPESLFNKCSSCKFLNFSNFYFWNSSAFFIKQMKVHICLIKKAEEFCMVELKPGGFSRVFKGCKKGILA